jgi:hypothetical protein
VILAEIRHDDAERRRRQQLQRTRNSRWSAAVFAAFALCKMFPSYFHIPNCVNLPRVYVIFVWESVTYKSTNLSQLTLHTNIAHDKLTTHNTTDTSTEKNIHTNCSTPAK